MDWAKTVARQDENYLCFGISASYIRDLRYFDIVINSIRKYDTLFVGNILSDDQYAFSDKFINHHMWNE